MAQAKHTPGPWFATEVANQNSNDFFRIGPAGMAPVAILADGNHVDSIDANAALIKSSPELLEMLIQVRNAFLNDEKDALRGILCGDVCADLLYKATRGGYFNGYAKDAGATA